MRDRLCAKVKGYEHCDADMRSADVIARIFEHYGCNIALVIHTAAQPSHDRAATNPEVDFTVNANGTSVLLEVTRRYSPDGVFIFMSTNKVYRDGPNQLPLVEHETRWEVEGAWELLQHIGYTFYTLSGTSAFRRTRVISRDSNVNVVAVHGDFAPL
jgi:CDP-paratose 2-epimerase